MNKISVLVLLICGIALGGIGGYFFVLNYEHSFAKSPEAAISAGKGASQSHHMQPEAYLRPYDNKLILPSEQLAKPRSEQNAYLRPYDNKVVDFSTRAPTMAPTSLATLPRKATKPVLISAKKPVTSDVRGNLGPASTITNEKMEDWLTDRWQGMEFRYVITTHKLHLHHCYHIISYSSSHVAARNMGGDPIPGEHWVEIDLQGLFYIDKVFIDWEVAFSNDWTVQVCIAI